MAAGGSIDDASDPCLPEVDEGSNSLWKPDFGQSNCSRELAGTTQEQPPPPPPPQAFRPPQGSIAELLNDRGELTSEAGSSNRESSAHFSELQHEIQLRAGGIHSPFEARSLQDPRDTWGQGFGGGMQSPTYRMASDLPLRNRTEAMLFRYYLQKLATCVSFLKQLPMSPCDAILTSVAYSSTCVTPCGTLNWLYRIARATATCC